MSIHADIQEVNKNNFKLEITPFQEDIINFTFKINKKELYYLYSQLRDIFENNIQKE